MEMFQDNQPEEENKEATDYAGLWAHPGINSKALRLQN